MHCLKNVWTMVAWAREIDRSDALFARRIAGVPLLLYRRADGSPVALHDQCPHRFAPLSSGQRHGDLVACGYHGLRFDAEGRCVHTPFGGAVPAAARVASYPVVERHTAVWVWLGAPEAADPRTIPDFSFMDGPGIGRGYLHLQAHYELLNDNLLDLSHIEFVHTGTFGGGGVIFQGQHSVQQDGTTLWSNWDMPCIDPPPWAPAGGKVDHWLHTRWNPPASMVLEIGIAPAGTPRGQVPGMKGANIVSPESDSSAHYFYTYPDFGHNAPDAVGRAFRDEDRPMLEAVQARMGSAEFWAMQPVLLPVDAAAVRARRLLKDLIQAEAGAATASATRPGTDPMTSPPDLTP